MPDAGAILATAGSDPTRRHSERRWAVLAEQPLPVRAEPEEVERLMVALLDAADAVVAIATDPASLPLSGLQLTAAGRRLRP